MKNYNDIFDSIKISKEEIRHNLNEYHNCNIPTTAVLSQFEDYIKRLEDPSYPISEAITYRKISKAIKGLFNSKSALIETIYDVLKIEIPDDVKLNEIAPYLITSISIKIIPNKFSFAFSSTEVYDGMVKLGRQC